MIKYTTFIASLLLSINSYAFYCGFVSNPDIKHFCYALEKKDSNQCSFIKEDNIKYACLAEVSKSDNYCNFITDNDIRYLCKVRASF